MSFSSTVLALSPLAYWKLDETSGTTFADSSGNGRTATITGAPILGRPPLVDGHCAGFNGNIANRAATGSTTWLQSKTAMSVMAVIQTSASTAGLPELVGADSTGTRQFQCRLTSAAKVEFIQFYTGSFVDALGNTALNDGKKHLVIVTVANSGNIKVYIDGYLDSTTAFAHSIIANYTDTVGIGHDPDGPSLPWDGSLEKVAIFGTELTGAQVQSIWAQIIGTSAYDTAVLADTPSLFWKLDDTTGTTITDSSGNSRNGTYSGATLQQPAVPPAGALASVLGGASGQGIGSITSASWMNNAAFSAECWVRPANANAFKGYLSRYQFAPGGWLLFQNSQQFGWDVASTGADNIIYAPGTYTLGRAYHLVGTYDGSTQCLYVDGRLAVSQALAGVSGSITQDLQVGGYAGINYAQANISKALYYPVALSAAQVLAHYRAAQALAIQPIRILQQTAVLCATR